MIFCMADIADIRQILAEVLNLGDEAKEMQAGTPLLGHIPELDSMAVVELISALETQYGFQVHDDDIELDTFETLGNLTDFVNSKVA